MLPVSRNGPLGHTRNARNWIGESGRCLARSEVGRGSGGRGGGSGGSRDRGGLRALAGCPGVLECLPGLKSTTANLRTGQFNVLARLEVRVYV
jgi:hypothetical protein